MTTAGAAARARFDTLRAEFALMEASVPNLREFPFNPAGYAQYNAIHDAWARHLTVLEAEIQAAGAAWQQARKGV